MPRCAVSYRFAIRFSDNDNECRVASGSQSLTQALVHKGTRLEQSHKSIRWANVDDRPRASTSDLTDWAGKAMNRLADDPDNPCCSVIVVI